MTSRRILILICAISILLIGAAEATPTVDYVTITSGGHLSTIDPYKITSYWSGEWNLGLWDLYLDNGGEGTSTNHFNYYWEINVMEDIPYWPDSLVASQEVHFEMYRPTDDSSYYKYRSKIGSGAWSDWTDHPNSDTSPFRKIEDIPINLNLGTGTYNLYTKLRVYSEDTFFNTYSDWKESTHTSTQITNPPHVAYWSGLSTGSSTVGLNQIFDASSLIAYNDGGPGGVSYVTVLTDSEYLEFNRIIPETGGSIDIYIPGDSVTYSNGDFREFNGYLVDATETLSPNSYIGLSNIRFSPTRKGTYHIYWRAAFDTPATGNNFIRDPGPGSTTDPLGYYAYSYTINVPNSAPVINSYNPTTLSPSVNEGGSLSFSASAIDLDSGDTLSYSWKLGSVQKSTSSSWTYTPGYSDSGTKTVTLTVSDGSLTATKTWTVTVVNMNRAPTINSYLPTSLTPSVNEGSSLAFSASASDPDGTTPSYSWKLGSVQQSTSSSWTYTPGYLDSGTKTVTLTVSDGSLTATKTWTVTVVNVNRAPTINSFLPASLTPSVNEGSSLSFSASASDLDGTTPSYSWKLGSVEQSTSSSWTYTPGYSDSGTKTVTLTVSDGSLTATKTWTVTVNDADSTVPEAPSNIFWDDGTVSPDTNIVANWGDVTDTSGVIDYHLQVDEDSSDFSSGMIFDGLLGSSVSMRTLTSSEGVKMGHTYYFRVAAKNGAGLLGDWSTISLGVTVNNPPNEPSNPSPSDGAINQPINPTLSWSGGDPDLGDSVTYDVYLDSSINPITKQCSSILSTSCDITSLNYSQQYYWKVIAIDSHGDTNSSQIWSFTTELQQPPKLISGPYVSSITSHSATISWTTDQLSDSTVQYGTTIDSLEEIFDSNFVTQHSITIENLLHSTNYLYGIESSNSNGGFGVGTWLFTTNTPDLNPPVLVSSNPADGSTNIPVTQKTVSFTFNEAMQQNVSVILWNLNSSYTNNISIDWSLDQKTVYFTFDRDLPPNTMVIWDLESGFKDLAGNPLPADRYSVNFTTGTEISDNIPPILISSDPSNGDVNIPVTQRTVSFTFNEAMIPSISVTWWNLNEEYVDNATTEWSMDQKTVYFTFDRDLPANRMVIWDLNPSDHGLGFTDLSGNRLPVDMYSGSFNTSSLVSDSIPPVLLSSNPADGIANIPVTQRTISFTFNESMQSRISVTWWNLNEDYANNATTEWSMDQKTVSFTFDRDLPVNTTISWVLNPSTHPYGFYDFAGNPLPADTYFGRFSTAPAVEDQLVNTSNGIARLTTPDGFINESSAVDESSLPPLPDVEFPFGVFKFNISDLEIGQTISVSIELPQELPEDSSYWKYGRTNSDLTPHWYEIPMEISDDNRNIIIQLTDGGMGDDDLIANGIIVDDGAPGMSPGSVNLTFNVTNSTGWPVIGATVSVHKFKMKTNETGIAEFINLAPGTYKCAIRKKGYIRTSDIIIVNKDKTIPVNLVLRRK